MFNLAQTTAPIIPETWTPTAVITVATLIIGLLAGTLIPAIIGLLNSIQAKKEAREAKTDAVAAKVNSAEAQGQAKAQENVLANLSATNLQQAGQLHQIAAAMPPIGSGGTQQPRSNDGSAGL